MKNVIFWGATSQAHVLREAIAESEFRLIALFDNRPLQSPFVDVPLFIGPEGFSSWLSGISSPESIHACVAVGGNRGIERLMLQHWLQEQGIQPITIVHRNAFVANNVVIGQGSQILAMSALCAGARLGDAVIVNTSASVDHGCIVERGVHIAPGARIAGDVHIEEHVFVGTGAVILPRIKIGRGAVIGAGAVVIRDVAAGQTVVGNPARPLAR